MGMDIESRIQQRVQLSDREIADFCQRWGIREMALFGSVLREDFRSDSDIDILIKFETNARQGLITLAKIKHELEERLNRRVDVVVRASVENSENWIRRQEILRTARVIYEPRGKSVSPNR